MEYPKLPERKLIDVPAISRASRGTCIDFTNHVAGISGRQHPRHDGRGSTEKKLASPAGNIHDTMVVVAQKRSTSAHLHRYLQIFH